MKLFKKLENMFSAASFAEAGEFETAREIASERKVLLVLTGNEADTKSLYYALNIARRTQASLEVLAAIDGRSATIEKMLELCEQQARKDSTELRIVRKSGCIREAILARASDRRDLVCVVIESTDAVNTGCSREEKKLTGIWERLSCPVALVSEKAQ